MRYSVDLASYSYTRLLQARAGKKRLQERWWKIVRKLLVRYLSDPECQLLIHGRPLRMPLSHDLPLYKQRHPLYDELPGRLSRFLHSEDESLCCIDVGANIGDSIAALQQHPADQFLAVEPNPTFYGYLLKNCVAMEHVTSVQVICSSTDDKHGYTIDEKRGTASVVKAPLQQGSGTKVADTTRAHFAQTAQSLDALVASQAGFAEVDLIKVDTDGHDFEVLRGASNTIAGSLPAVLFECDNFGNSEYSNNIDQTFTYFHQCGYEQFLVYDNFGYLMGCYSLVDTRAFHNLVLYQLTSSFHYFDVLIMKSPDLAQFYRLESEFFIETMQNISLRDAARVSVNAVRVESGDQRSSSKPIVGSIEKST